MIAVKTFLAITVFGIGTTPTGRRRACSHRYDMPFAQLLRKVSAMELIKALTFGAILSAAVAIVIGSQGTSAGPLAIQLMALGSVKFYWSWPIFFGGTGLSFGILLLQR
jgi:hypothetical protein